MITTHAFSQYPPFFFYNPSGNHYIIDYIVYHVLAEGKSKKNLAARLFRVLESISLEFKPQDEEFKIRLRALVLGLTQTYRYGLVRELLSEDGNAAPYLQSSTMQTDCLRAAALLGLPELYTEIAAAYTAPGAKELDIHTYPHAGLFLCSAFEYAAQGGHFDLVGKILDGLEEKGMLPIESHWIGAAVEAAIHENHEHIVRHLLQPKYEYSPPPGENSLIREAAAVDNPEMLKYLCDRLTVSLGDPMIMHIAAANNHKSIVELSLASGGDVNKTTGRWETPLAIASQHGHTDMVRFLLSHGAELGRGEHQQ
ncbi:ankyrin repeat-containing domain protein [Tricladium varicosporioides]|nr:ankyrin repeat-containing domain protein [Hymenoscyphus varicosporioides]